MKQPLGASISHMLKARGVEVIFGIPGVHNQEMYRGIAEAGITHVLARHEQGAGFMADGYARATGRPGVAYVITGPGLTNILTPLGQAYSDSVPVLAISSCLDETAATRGQLHQMKDQRAAAGTVCEWSEEARSAQAAYALIDRALTQFRTDRPRPRHLQVPIRLLEGDAPPPPPPPEPPETLRRPGREEDIAELSDRISAARRPLMIFGGGAARGGERFRDTLQREGIASFVTYAGKGAVTTDDPLFFGAYLPRPSSAEVIASADFVMALGTDLAEVDLWRHKLGETVPLHQVNIDAEALDPGRGPVYHGDAGMLLDELAAFLSASPHHRTASEWSADEVAARRDQWRAQTDAERPGIVPVCDALRTAIPADTMIYSDMTQFAYVAKEVWDMERPGHWHHPTGFGTLGYALPAAIGGAVGRPGLPTMAIAGDYGFQYTMQELGVAVELGLSLPIILWDNGKLKEIEDSMVAAQIAPNAVEARNPDFPKLAEAFGAASAEPRNLGELQDVVGSAFGAGRPTLIRLVPGIAA